MRKDKSRKYRHLLHCGWVIAARIPALAYGLAVVLAILAISASATLAAKPLEILVPSSSAPVQVTTPPTPGAAANLAPRHQLEAETEPMSVMGQWLQARSWLLPVAGGILLWMLGTLAVLVILALLFLRARRRRLRVAAPPPRLSIPFLESSDGSLYFRLDGVDAIGLIIGRGKRGVDLRIEESTPQVDTVSNWHARIYHDAKSGFVIIEDLDSTNGVFINGRRAPRKNLLKDGWVVGLGSVTMTYHDGESDTGPLD